MIASEPCPDNSELIQLLSDQLQSERVHQLEQHISDCAACQTRLTTLESFPFADSDLQDLANEKNDSGELSEVIGKAKYFMDSSEELPNPGGDSSPSDRVDPGLSDPQLVGSDDVRLEADRKKLLDDGFEILERIGHGGMGIVYKARELSLDRHVAIKVLNDRLKENKNALARFLRESKSAAAVVHPNVVTIHSVSDRPDFPYLVMEFVDGYSLEERLKKENSFSIENTIRIGRQIIAALEAAHAKGIVHRDVKPANVMINRTSGLVLLSDFGIAKYLQQNSVGDSDVVVGTPAYLGPEVLNGKSDHRSDLFSLGVLLYELCSGVSPFQADTVLATINRVANQFPEDLTSLSPEVPGWFAGVVRKLMSKNPDDRYQSATELKEALKSPKSEKKAIQIPIVEKVKTKNGTPLTGKLVIGGIVVGFLISLYFLVFHFGGVGNPEVAEEKSKEIDNEVKAKPLSKKDLVKAKGDSPGSKKSNQETVRPFLCLKPDGSNAGQFETLELALKNLNDGGTIQIEYEGAIHISTGVVIETNVTIISEATTRQELVFSPYGLDEDAPLFSIDGNLTIQNIELSNVDSADRDTPLIEVNDGGSLALVNCGLMLKGGEDAEASISTEGNLSLKNCLIQSPFSTAFEIHGAGDKPVQFENCWIAGAQVFFVSTTVPVHIELSQCTLACNALLQFEDEEERSIGTVQLNAVESVFVIGEQLVQGLEATDTDGFSHNLTWTGSENVYSGTLFDEFENDDDVEPAQQLAAWFKLATDHTSTFEKNVFEAESEDLFESIEELGFRFSSLPLKSDIKAGAQVISPDDTK